METDYNKLGTDFATKVGLTMKIVSTRYGKHFEDDKDNRYIFRITLKRNKKSYTFDFGQAVASGNEAPSIYDVLSCLEKYDVGSYQDFCSEFGYEMYNEKCQGFNRITLKTYKAVCKEFIAVDRLFSDVMDELQNIY